MKRRDFFFITPALGSTVAFQPQLATRGNPVTQASTSSPSSEGLVPVNVDTFIRAGNRPLFQAKVDCAGIGAWTHDPDF
jgi:hypothetical protein